MKANERKLEIPIPEDNYKHQDTLALIMRAQFDKRYPHVNVIKVWETGSMPNLSNSVTSTKIFYRTLHVVITDKDKRRPYEYDGWPHFKLCI
jgi:hypothetical protein